MLASMLNSLKDEKKVQLAVADSKLGNSITKLPGLDISTFSPRTSTP
jgi:nucleolar protein 58